MTSTEIAAASEAEILTWANQAHETHALSFCNLGAALPVVDDEHFDVAVDLRLDRAQAARESRAGSERDDHDRGAHATSAATPHADPSQEPIWKGQQRSSHVTRTFTLGPG